MGRSTFEGVLPAFDRKIDSPIKDYNNFIESAKNPVPVVLENGRRAYVFALAHCGAMGTLNRNRKENTSLDNQLNDWRKIKKYLNR